MNKYERLKAELDEAGTGKMRCFGNSMIPILYTGCELTFIKQEDYEIGDIVFSKVKGRWIDAHKIVQKDLKRGYLIANNHGHLNGWTHQIFGKAIKAEYSNKQAKEL